ncbi:MAG: molybdate ABC transporter substrate-binding protein [Chloroflexi bacterium]|nr:molybdate ABC transporter substrate-binding protein [Chloroflexota bacterium]
MNRFVFLFALLAGLVFALAACAAAPRDPLLVSAAANLNPAFDDLAQGFREETGLDVSFNFAASGKLAQQIEQGAPVDAFAAADERYIDELVQAAALTPDSRRVFARGRLVLWTRADSPLIIERIDDLLDPRVLRIALANPDHAPYGAAAREALQHAGVWEEVQSRLILGENVLQALQFAETGNVDAAIVSLSLALDAGGRYALIPESLHHPLNQTIAIVAGAAHPQAAQRFIDYLDSPAAREALRAYGFALPGEDF